MIFPKPLRGTVQAIASKSVAHRLLICAALADRPTRIRLGASSEDIDATAACLRALGSAITREPDGFCVVPIAAAPEDPLLDCRESGSTLRFLLPTATALCSRVRFTGAGRLPERPIGALMRAMQAHGVAFSRDSLPFATSGRLEPGHFTIPGDISSQYISGLLLALCALGGGSSIDLATELESSAYVDLTCRALARFGITVIRTQSGWQIPPRQRYHSPGEIEVEGDWSNSGFFLAAGALGSELMVRGLDPASPQGDHRMLGILRSFGAAVTEEPDRVTVRAGNLTARTVDVREIPDALPILAVVAACAKGETQFIHAGRLRLKESDRLTATARMIRSLGGIAQERPEGLVIRGSALTGGTVDGAGDHRIVMAAAIAATVCTGPVTITGAQAAGKSYPRFFEDYAALGGEVHVV